MHAKKCDQFQFVSELFMDTHLKEHFTCSVRNAHIYIFMKPNVLNGLLRNFAGVNVATLIAASLCR